MPQQPLAHLPPPQHGELQLRRLGGPVGIAGEKEAKPRVRGFAQARLGIPQRRVNDLLREARLNDQGLSLVPLLVAFSFLDLAVFREGVESGPEAADQAVGDGAVGFGKRMDERAHS